MEIVEEVKKIIQKPIESLGYILSSVEYINEDGNNFLRVIIDKDGYIEIEDCVAVTKLIDPMLDDIGCIKDSYILDVCSKEKGCD